MDTPSLLHQTGLLQRWKGRDRFVVFQTDFLNGLPFLDLWSAWRADPNPPQRLHVFAPANPSPPGGLRALHIKQFPHLAELAELLHSHWPQPVSGLHRLEFEQGRVILTLGFGTLAHLNPQLRANAFLIPSSNRDPTNEFPFHHLARFAEPDALLAAFDLSETQRSALLQGGFHTAASPDSKFWTGQLLRKKPLPTASHPHSAVVVGAGLAGTAIAFRLAQRGWQITLLEKHPSPASEASGNRAAVFSPMVSKDENRSARLSRACFLQLHREILQLTDRGAPVEWSNCGVLQLANSPEHEPNLREIAAPFPGTYIQALPSETVRDRIGNPVPALFFPMGGWVNPASLCAARLQAAGHRLRRSFSQEAFQIQSTGDGWLVLGKDATPLAQAPILILANAHEALHFPQLHGLRLKKVRGQVTHLPAHLLPPVSHVLCGDGYLTPSHQGLCCLGATYDFNTDSRTLEPAGHRTNLARLPKLLRSPPPPVDPENLRGRVGFRTLTPDRLPLVGALPDFSQPPADELWKIPRIPGLYGLLGLGSRGLVWSSLMAELLASQITGDPLPVERDLAQATDPARFRVREFRDAKSA